MLAGAGLTQLKLAKKRRKLVITPDYASYRRELSIALLGLHLLAGLCDV